MTEPSEEDSKEGTSLGLGERIYLHIYDYETKEFSGLTTYHGLVRIYNSNTWPSRIFWCVVVLSCLSLFMIHSGYLLLGYHAKPTLFQVNTMVPDAGMQFPDITICNYNPVMPAKLKGWNISDELVAYLLDSYSPDSRLSPNEMERIDKELVEYKETYANRTGEEFDVTSFLRAVGPSCEDMILRCAFAGRDIPNCCQLATTIQTDIGMCTRFESAKFMKRQWFSGSGFGWQFVVDGKNHLKTDLLPNLFSDDGIRILIHEEGKEVSLQSNGISAPPGAAIYAGIDTKNISLLRRVDWGVCQKTWDPLIHEQVLLPLNYTSDHCEWNCQVQGYLSRCGCIPISLRFNTSFPTCSGLQLSKCNKMALENPFPRCECDRECDMMEYNIQMSYADITTRSIDSSLQLTEEYIEDSISVAWIYFRSISYERHEQQKQLQTADLLSNIAGSMGLFLGMSTVTLLEIFIYLFKSVWGTVNTERQNQFMQAMLDEEEERRQSVVIVEEPEEQIIDDEPDGSSRRASRRLSVMPIHIHMDRRGSRMMGRRDSNLFDRTPRRSISVAPQYIPTLGHRQSIAIGSLGERAAAASGDILPGRRGSALPQMSKRISIEIPSFGGRRLSTQPDEARRLSVFNPAASRRKSSINPKHFLL